MLLTKLVELNNVVNRYVAIKIAVFYSKLWTTSDVCRVCCHVVLSHVHRSPHCAYNVRSCFHRLGLNTKETKVALSELTSTAIQCVIHTCHI